jgi:hypothetical protein
MLLSHRKKFIYTKTLKTAGTSVESYFEPFCMADDEWTLSHYRDEYSSESGVIGYRGMNMPKDCTWWSHMPAALIRERIGETVWNEYFKFCVIRNPYEKALSTFYWRKNVGTIKVDDTDSENIQFEKWLMTSGPPIDRETYLIGNEFCLDAILRYETLMDDLEKVCVRLHIPWKPENIPSFKSGVRPRHGTAKNIYTKKAIEIVQAAYSFEFQYFGYSFPA